MVNLDENIEKETEAIGKYQKKRSEIFAALW